ncbi:MAG TPA: hypothetical protein DDZ80_28005 [Cyanobacteria bacterium UBA8803]|nr:hypothetical protein [Cyanobacteria bacterium UBA9273]HBL62108.1 hypothetical protein [Cyanobacteria bacterium UBA8803]
MEISLNLDTKTIEIRVPANRVPDELIGVLTEATTTAEGCLAWSIRYGDVRRSSSSSTVKDELLGVVETLVGETSSEDELLGVVETLVRETASTVSSTSSSEPASVIRGTLILTFNNSPITEALTSLGGRSIPIFADNIAPPSSSSVSSSNLSRFSDTLGILPNPTEVPVLLFANPFSA